MDKLLAGRPHIVELLTPKQSDESFEDSLEVFAQRYRRVLAAGAVVSIPDNPMGNLHFGAVEVAEHLSLPLDPERTLLHLNSFHRRQDLDELLGRAADLGLRNLLLVSGDGGPRLPKLEPADIGSEGKAVTSVELLRYVQREFPGRFRCGVAFNHYEPQEHEREKLRRKLEAGACFVITQPVVCCADAVSALESLPVPVWVGAWMSKRVDLLLACVGATVPAEATGEADSEAPAYDPYANLAALETAYPGFGIYYSLMPFKRDWEPLLSRTRTVGKVA